MSHKATNWLASLDPNLLGHSEFRVLFHLCDCHNPSLGCFPTQSYLIAQTGASNGTVNNALNALEHKGLIQRHRERDGRSKRQKPTRYLLAFEGFVPAPDEAKPSPEIGVGAVSNSEGEPSPIQRATRLQPTGEEPVSNQELTRRAGGQAGELSEIGAFWVDQIRSGKVAGASAIKPAVAAEIRASGLLDAGQLKSAGIER